MADETIITSEMKKEINTTLNIQITQIEKRLVEQYILATNDSNPLWFDDDFGLKAGYGGAIVPPGVLVTMQMEGGSPSEYMPAQSNLGGAIDGGGEWIFYRPIRVGDTVIAVRKLKDITEKRGKLGSMILNTIEVVFYNQKSQIVAKSSWRTFRHPIEA